MACFARAEESDRVEELPLSAAVPELSGAQDSQVANGGKNGQTRSQAALVVDHFLE